MRLDFDNGSKRALVRLAPGLLTRLFQAPTQVSSAPARLVGMDTRGVYAGLCSRPVHGGMGSESVMLAISAHLEVV